MDEMKLNNENTIDEVAKIIEQPKTSNGVNSALLIGIGAAGAIGLTKLLNWGWNKIKNHKAKTAEGETDASEDELPDLPPVEDPE